MKREVIKFCILSLPCTKKKEQKGIQAYKTQKTQKENRDCCIHDWEKLVDQKKELPGYS